MTQVNREVVEGLQIQGSQESIIYSLTTTPWGSTPTSISVLVKNMTAGGTDVTTTVMPINSPSASGDIITLSALKLLTAGNTYRVEVTFHSGGNIFVPYFAVKAED